MEAIDNEWARGIYRGYRSELETFGRRSGMERPIPIGSYRLIGVGEVGIEHPMAADDRGGVDLRKTRRISRRWRR